ncbi:MAG: hypothetical protein KA140_07400 [Caldisericia bacterium]|nr:hypothetical protein [Caldisericia bacterium]
MRPQALPTHLTTTSPMLNCNDIDFEYDAAGRRVEKTFNHREISNIMTTMRSPYNSVHLS